MGTDPAEEEGSTGQERHRNSKEGTEECVCECVYMCVHACMRTHAQTSERKREGRRERDRLTCIVQAGFNFELAVQSLV